MEWGCLMFCVSVCPGETSRDGGGDGSCLDWPWAGTSHSGPLQCWHWSDWNFLHAGYRHQEVRGHRKSWYYEDWWEHYRLTSPLISLIAFFSVECIRAQRAFSIQMPDQYVFCHLAFLEYVLNMGYVEEIDLTGFDEDDLVDWTFREKKSYLAVMIMMANCQI